MYNDFIDVSELLADKVTDIFTAIQSKLGISCGDIEPLQEYELQKRTDYLAEYISELLETQRNL